MLNSVIVIAAIAFAQQPAEPAKVEVPVLKAGLGACSADFVVKDANAQPVYGANVHVRIRYGFMNVKRMDLEIGTNSDGKARFEGLPAKAKPLVYDVQKDTLKSTVEQDVASRCEAKFDVTLK
jgi:hypothetical protein